MSDAVYNLITVEVVTTIFEELQVNEEQKVVGTGE